MKALELDSSSYKYGAKAFHQEEFVKELTWVVKAPAGTEVSLTVSGKMRKQNSVHHLVVGPRAGPLNPRPGGLYQDSILQWFAGAPPCTRPHFLAKENGEVRRGDPVPYLCATMGTLGRFLEALHASSRKSFR